MVQLIHHEKPVNKTIRHKRAEVMILLTLVIGSLSFFIYTYAAREADNPLCRYLIIAGAVWLVLVFGILCLFLHRARQRNNKPNQKKRQ